VGAARDQGHPLAGPLELRAEVPADTARPHHHDVHDTYDTLRGSMASLERRVAIDAARAAGQLLKSELPGSRRIAYKGSPTNLVTEMDARVEELIVGRLAAAFPDDAVLAEERGATAGRSGRRWIIDPLDGTTNYAHGLPTFAVSIALETAKRVDLGVVFDPNLDELFVAERGHGATLNDRPLAVSTAATLDESLLATGFPYNIREARDNNLKEYAAFSVRARAVRRMGSAVLYLAWLASGRLDGYWELRLGPWDVAAGSLLVEEAGGQVTDLTGGALDLDAPALVATNGRIHSAILAVLGEVRGGKP
jgi:myo-inositol-1(or 4)-monophosphatase